MNQELLTKILNHIISYQDNAIYHGKVIEIYQGQLKKYIVEALIQEFPKSYPQMLNQIPPINLIKQYVQKTNQAYIEAPRRTITTGTEDDQALMDYLVEKLEINELMEQMASYLTLNKYASIQLAYDPDTQSPILEFLPANHFIPFSANPKFPNVLTHLIKFAGKKDKVVATITIDSNGKKLDSPQTEIRTVNVYHIFDKDYLYIVEGTELVKQEPNEYQKLPFLFGREVKDQLIPTPDSDMLAMAILLPKKLASLNNALKAQSHSIIYGIDVDLSGNIIAPDIVWNLKSEYKGDQPTNPTIGTISPSVQTSSVIESYEFQLRSWLESKGIKAGQRSQTSSMASGDSKAMDEADATAVRQNKVRLMAKLEKEFWGLFKTCWDIWTANGLEQSYIDDGFDYPFSFDFKMNIIYASQEPKEDTVTILNELKLMKDLGILTDRMALERLYPEKDATDIDKILADLEEQNTKKIEQAQQMMGPNQTPVNGKPDNVTPQDKPADPKPKE